jgi:etoposide-induced 2.4 mRNA
MATRSRPLPADPYNPVPSDGSEAVRHPSPFVPLRLPIFRPVILINDLIVRVLSVGAGGKQAASSSSSNDVSSKLGRKTRGYGYTDGFDSIEEGGDTEIIELHAMAAGEATPTPSVAGRRRVNIRRKKLD